MKNLLKIFMMAIFVVLLAGCVTITTKTTSETTATTFLTETTNPNLISTSKVLTVNDFAPDYNITGTTLQAYKDREDPYTSYVSVSEFINFMQGGIFELDVQKTDMMNISYTFDIPVEDQQPGGPTSYLR